MAIQQVDISGRPRNRLVDLRSRRRGATGIPAIYEATADEIEEEELEEGEIPTVQAKALERDGTLVGDELTFYTLAPYEEPEEEE